MTQEELHKVARTHPFQPFRLILSTGATYAIRHPDLIMVGEQHKASNPANGINAIIGLEQRSWGTHVAIQLTGVHGPLKCDLVAVSKTGETQVITNWIVPSPGYGVPGNEQPLVLHGGAAMNKSEIDHFVVRTLDGRTLITIPM